MRASNVDWLPDVLALKYTFDVEIYFLVKSLSRSSFLLYSMAIIIHLDLFLSSLPEIS